MHLNPEKIMTNYNESISGDLSDDNFYPTFIWLTEGSNIVKGSASGEPFDQDFFTFEVPKGYAVEAIELVDYQWGDGSQTDFYYGDSLFAVTEGSFFASLSDDSTVSVVKLIDDAYGDSEVGQDLLDPFVGTVNGDKGGDGSLGPGTYSILYQEFGANITADTTYEFDIKLSSTAWYEAEDLSLNTYSVEQNDYASDGELVSLKNAYSNVGSISTEFLGNTDEYYAIVRYLDETDGESTLNFQVNGVSVESWKLDKNLGSPNADEQVFTERVISSILLYSGDTISIEGTKDGNEETRIDSIELVPFSDFYQYEAEDMILGNYQVEANDFASGDKLISLQNASGNAGTASMTFDGDYGIYDITVGYLDETDGVAQLDFSVDSYSIDSWRLNKNLGNADPIEQTFTERRISGVSLYIGSTITLAGEVDSTEWARVDFIRITPAVDYL